MNFCLNFVLQWHLLVTNELCLSLYQWRRETMDVEHTHPHGDAFMVEAETNACA